MASYTTPSAHQGERTATKKKKKKDDMYAIVLLELIHDIILNNDKFRAFIYQCLSAIKETGREDDVTLSFLDRVRFYYAFISLPEEDMPIQIKTTRDLYPELPIPLEQYRHDLEQRRRKLGLCYTMPASYFDRPEVKEAFQDWQEEEEDGDTHMMGRVIDMIISETRIIDRDRDLTYDEYVHIIRGERQMDRHRYYNDNRSPAIAINRSVLLNLRHQSPTMTEEERATWAFYFGICSLTGKKVYAKTTAPMLLARMFGCKTVKQCNELMRQRPDLKVLYDKYATRYHYERLKDRVVGYRLASIAGWKRNTYVSVKFFRSDALLRVAANQEWEVRAQVEKARCKAVKEQLLQAAKKLEAAIVPIQEVTGPISQ